MKFARVGAVLFGGLAIGASATVFAGGVDIGINLGVPVVPAPVYVAPPPPVYYPPAPVVVAPPPGFVIGWYGDRYWDGRRYWGRDEWRRHHPEGRGHWERRDRHGDHDDHDGHRH